MLSDLRAFFGDFNRDGVNFNCIEEVNVCYSIPETYMFAFRDAVLRMSSL